MKQRKDWKPGEMALCIPDAHSEERCASAVGSQALCTILAPADLFLCLYNGITEHPAYVVKFVHLPHESIAAWAILWTIDDPDAEQSKTTDRGLTV